MLIQALAAAIGLSVGGNSHAAALSLSLFALPDISIAYVQVNYNASTDLLTATGYVANYKTTTATYAVPMYSPNFQLSATINNLGVLSSGSFTVGGTVSELGFNSGTLLAGTLATGANFGFSAGSDQLDFVVKITSGDAATQFVTNSDVSDIHLSGITNNPPGSFSGTEQSFTSSMTGVADVRRIQRSNSTRVPEPATALLMVLGLFGLAFSAKVRRMKLGASLKPAFSMS